ncbi:MAG TPA: hypothetical protein VGC90_01055 [Candidatus Limnocylindrales bacterium]|jgi:hypothetical protein
MDERTVRKPQDIDRWSSEAERDGPADPIAGPQDRWVNESTRPEDTGAVAGGGVEPRATESTLDEGEPR